VSFQKALEIWWQANFWSSGGSNRLSRKIKSEPDWLPDPGIDFRAPCLITLMFINTGKDLNQKERIHVDTRCGVIESSKTGSKDRVFEVTLDEGFAIEVEKIFVTIDKSSNGTYRWKRSIPSHYQLNVEIKCHDHDDAIRFLSLLENKPASKYRRSLTEKDATLRATWLALPECPPIGKSLRLLRSDGVVHAVDTKYGVELSMGWSRKQDLPLVAYAKSRRAAVVPEEDQLPTPSASDESDNTPKEYIITYVFMNERSHTMKNLQCPLCATGPSLRARHEFSSFDRLHTHFLLWHDHFQPQVEDAEEDSSSVIRKTVHLTFATKPAEAQIQPMYEGEEEQWIAPQRPFDEKAYLKGEDTWTGHPKLKPMTKHDLKAERAQLHALKKQTSATSLPQIPMRSNNRPAPSAVLDIPNLPKPRWPLPKVPGIRFYRTKSKRPFESDEDVSESDEDVDESWLQAHKRDDMSSLPLSAGAKDFYQDWNLTLAQDDFPADVFAKEFLVRFARKFRAKLGQDDEYYDEFAKMVNRLHSLNFIDEEVRNYCCKRERTGHGAPIAPMGIASGSKTLGAASGELRVRTCICEKPVESARGAVMCDNIVSFPYLLSFLTSRWGFRPRTDNSV
jgi:hypothetical protein